MPHRHRVRLAATALVLATGVVGCSSANPAPRTGASFPASTPVVSTPSRTPTPTVSPAAGKVLSVTALSLHLTEDLRWLLPEQRTLVQSGTVVLGDGYPVTVTVSDIAAVQGDLGASADAFIAVSRKNPKPMRLANRTVNGVETWAAQQEDDTFHTFWIGGLHNGRDWTVEFEMPLTMPETDAVTLRERIIASIDFT